MKIVVDIDETILYSDLIDGEYHIKGINHILVTRINELWSKGNEIIIHTGRHWNQLDATMEQLTDAGIAFDTLIMGKPPADYYIDDKAIKPEDFVNLDI